VNAALAPDFYLRNNRRVDSAVYDALITSNGPDGSIAFGMSAKLFGGGRAPRTFTAARFAW